MKKQNKKLNEGCLKIFKFIKLLYEDKAYYKDVTDIFRDEFNSQTNNNIQVCLNKYINALKVFGIKITKHRMLDRLNEIHDGWIYRGNNKVQRAVEKLSGIHAKLWEVALKVRDSLSPASS